MTSNCLNHFSHPKHELKPSQHNNRQFICDLCYTLGTGYRYRCNTCDFDIHYNCVNYPQTISFFAHPWHTLSLMQGPAETARVCDLCSKPVQGFFYRCVPCAFDLHPHCSLKLQSVRTELHPQHSLTMLPARGTCSACKNYCGPWIYRCGICCVDFHTDCVYFPTGRKEGEERKHHSKMKYALLKFGRDLAIEVTLQVVAGQTASLLLN